jgi:O-antigen/teichoic acid export membrane protein
VLLFPLTALEHESVGQNKFGKIISFTVVVSIVTAVAAVFIFPYFIHYAVGDGYAASYLPFVYLLPGVLVFSINILLAARLAGKGNTTINMQGSALCFIIILLLDIWLIPSFNIKGAAIASSIGYSVSTLFVIIKYRKWISA